MGYARGDSLFSILNRIDFHLVQNRKENCHHEHIVFNMKGNGVLVLSVYEAVWIDLTTGLLLFGALVVYIIQGRKYHNCFQVM